MTPVDFWYYLDQCVKFFIQKELAAHICAILRKVYLVLNKKLTRKNVNAGEHAFWQISGY